MMLSIEEKRQIDEMDAEALQAFKDGVKQVYAELDRTGASFPYLLDGKVIQITTAQLRALQAQASDATLSGQPEMR